MNPRTQKRMLTKAQRIARTEISIEEMIPNLGIERMINISFDTPNDYAIP